MFKRLCLLYGPYCVTLGPQIGGKPRREGGEPGAKVATVTNTFRPTFCDAVGD